MARRLDRPRSADASGGAYAEITPSITRRDQLLSAPPVRRCLSSTPPHWQPILDAVQGLEVSDILITRALGSHRQGRRPQREDRARIWAPCEKHWLADLSQPLARTPVLAATDHAPPADELLEGGETIRLGRGDRGAGQPLPHLSVMGDVVFGGTSLPARWDAPTFRRRLGLLLRSIREQLTLDPKTTVLPGHGPATTSSGRCRPIRSSGKVRPFLPDRVTLL